MLHNKTETVCLKCSALFLVGCCWIGVTSSLPSEVSFSFFFFLNKSTIFSLLHINSLHALDWFICYFYVLYCCNGTVSIKAQMKILSSFTHPHVVPNM